MTVGVALGCRKLQCNRNVTERTSCSPGFARLGSAVGFKFVYPVRVALSCPAVAYLCLYFTSFVLLAVYRQHQSVFDQDGLAATLTDNLNLRSTSRCIITLCNDFPSKPIIRLTYRSCSSRNLSRTIVFQSWVFRVESALVYIDKRTQVGGAVYANTAVYIAI